jgi:hypothetical protein
MFNLLLYVCVLNLSLTLFIFWKVFNSLPRSLKRLDQTPEKAGFGFAADGSWISVKDMKDARKLLAKLAKKSDLYESEVEVLAKFLGLDAMPWENKMAGYEMEFQELLEFNHHDKKYKTLDKQAK